MGLKTSFYNLTHKHNEIKRDLKRKSFALGPVLRWKLFESSFIVETSYELGKMEITELAIQEYTSLSIINDVLYSEKPFDSHLSSFNFSLAYMIYLNENVSLDPQITYYNQKLDVVTGYISSGGLELTELNNSGIEFSLGLSLYIR